MARGGKRDGAGRKEGSVNKKTVAIEEWAKSFGVTPLEYLLTVMNCEDNTKDIRIDAGKAAAPYVHCKMPTALQITGSLEILHESALDDLE